MLLALNAILELYVGVDDKSLLQRKRRLEVVQVGFELRDCEDYNLFKSLWDA